MRESLDDALNGKMQISKKKTKRIGSRSKGTNPRALGTNPRARKLKETNCE
jgi:hypothetical protein